MSLFSYLKNSMTRRKFLGGIIGGIAALVTGKTLLSKEIDTEVKKIKPEVNKKLSPPVFKIDKVADVWFIPTETQDPVELARLTEKIYKKAGFDSIIKEDKLVALKQHFGAQNNKGFIKPEIIKTVGELIKKQKGRPLAVETNTLYKGARSDSYNHLEIALEHGFSHEKLGFPIAILDGVNGQNQKTVPIPGVHFNSVNMVSDLPFFESMMILSHVKGHPAAGMGGAIKNLAMGFASRAGKLAQHSDFLPKFNDKCVRCGLCVNSCPVNALSMGNKKVVVDKTKCIGCGQCLTACRFDAIDFKFGQGKRSFSEKMAEHAFGAVIFHNRKVGYINYFNFVSKFCDCFNIENPALHKNIGLFASYDPVAIDQACYDMGVKTYGKDVFKEFFPKRNAQEQIKHASKIGMGTRKYRLIKI